MPHWVYRSLSALALTAMHIIPIAAQARDIRGIEPASISRPLLREFAMAVFQDTLSQHWIVGGDRPCSVSVYSSNTIPCLKKWHTRYARLPTTLSGDSVSIWFYLTCDTAGERICPCCLVPAGGCDFKAVFFSGVLPVLSPFSVQDIDSLIFPPGSHETGHNMPMVKSIDVFEPDAANGKLLSMWVQDNSTGNHGHSDDRQGFWWWQSDSLVWLGSIWRDLYTVHGAENSHAMRSELEFTTEQTPDAVRLKYSRSFRSESGVWFGKLSDTHPISIAAGPSGIRVEGILGKTGRLIRVRNSLPVLIAEKLEGDPNDLATPPLTIAAPVFTQTTFLEPKLDPVSMDGLSDYHFRDALGQDVAASVRIWTKRDSLVVTFVCPDEQSVALWFDTALEGDFDDSLLSQDDRVYLVRPVGEASASRAEGFAIARREDGTAHFVVRDTAIVRSRRHPGGRELSVCLERADVGFEDSSNGAVCGFGLETIQHSAEFPNLTIEPLEVAPSGFQRANPHTWATLIAGTREDHIDERRLQRHLELRQRRAPK